MSEIVHIYMMDIYHVYIYIYRLYRYMFIMHSVFTFHMGPVKSTTWTPQGWQFHLHPLSKGSAMRRPRVKFQCSLRGGLVLGS